MGKSTFLTSSKACTAGSGRERQFFVPNLFLFDLYMLMLKRTPNFKRR
jgi:hypothetical protein